MNPTIAIVFLHHAVAVVALLHDCCKGIVCWSWISLAITSFTVRMFFINAFYHRYFSHRSYQTSRWMQFIFAVLGCTALQKGPLWWSSHHRNSHQHSSNDLNRRPLTLSEIFSSYGSWINFSDQYNEMKPEYIADWLSYLELFWLDKLHMIPYLFMGIVVHYFFGLIGVCWCLVIPQLPLWYFTCSIHFIADRWGTQRFLQYNNHKISARNNGWFAFFTLGEGWCNNHHADPRSACQGLLWYEFDPTFRILSCLNAFGVIWSMKSSELYGDIESDLNMNLLSTKMTNETVKLDKQASKSIPFATPIRYPCNSIYEGIVVHTRYHPIVNQFSYKLYLMYIELNDETIESAFDNYWFWSSRDKSVRTLPALASFRASEYLSKQQIQNMAHEEWENYGNKSMSKKPNSDSNETRQIMSPPRISRVFLLTHFRYFGLKFNPVSYYYCFDDHKNLVALVSEVHNTPWSELCWYVHLTPKNEKNEKSHCPAFILKSDLPPPSYYWTGNRIRYTDCKIKKMHVSPYFQMTYTYRVKYDSPDELLNVSWEMFSNRSNDEGRRDFYVTMRLKRIDISQSSLNKVMLRYPLMTAQVVLGIYYQAGMLYLRKVPFVTHPSKKKQCPDDKDNDDRRQQHVKT